MSKADVMRYLRISKGTVENLMREGLPHVKLKRRVLFRRDWIDSYLEARMTRAKATKKPST
jgi:excisionase family DNA binding protein